MQKPNDLKGEGSAFWDEVTSIYSLTPAEFRLLKRACKELDLIEALENDIDYSKLRRAGSMGNDISDPLISEIRQHGSIFIHLVKAMRIPDEAERENRSAMARKAANARWTKAS